MGQQRAYWPAQQKGQSHDSRNTEHVSVNRLETLWVCNTVERQKPY